MSNEALGRQIRGDPAQHKLRGIAVRLLLRPELTAVAGVLVAFSFFAFTAGSSGFLTLVGTRNYLEVASQVGIVAVAVCLLLIAGEFDLSVGAIISVAGMLFAYPIVHLHWPLWAGVLFALTVAAGIGATNGLLVVKTGVPSFLITLSTTFILLGCSVGITIALTQTTTVDNVVEAVAGDPLLNAFQGTVAGIPTMLFWWIGLTLIAAYVLDRLRVGNRIYASGGNADAAFRAGVHVRRVKIALYMCTALCAALVSIMQTLAIDQANVTNGPGTEFQAMTAAVIGGTLITGGSGSPIGTAVGALLFGMVSQGFYFTNISSQWYQTFLGSMLLLAVLVNHYTRAAAMKSRRSS
jgi:simple sugar transport system permease protein